MRLINLLIATAAVTAIAPAALAAPSYSVTKVVPLGAPDRWDYVVFDPGSGRVYVAHGDQVAVVDAHSGKVIGRISGIVGGTHGIAISKGTGRGFTDDGENGKTVAFDLKTLKIIKQIPAGEDADATYTDKLTGHVFVVEGDPGTITVVNPRSVAAITTIKVGEKLEYATGDDNGSVFVAGNGTGDVVRIDAKSNAVTAHWATPECKGPHGLAIDKIGRRLFMGCVNNVMMVVDANSGKIITKLPIGRGSDAIAWDPVRKRVFSSNGSDGTITVFQQSSPDTYKQLDTIRTQVSGRTMDVDPSSGRLFVAAATTDTSTGPGGRPRVKPATLALLMIDPKP
ncbi:MAG: YncE family protein [Pseudomonadota bacterium]|nr:YncE family protein [Pseudomonadota bacterium]